MQGSKKVLLTDLNEYITCKICSGYFIDATTIIECLHTFCRSCVVKYLESNKYCPICDVQVHKTKPLLNIRPDKTIQDIVFKLVPRLYHNEIQRRKEFYDSHPEGKPSSLEQHTETAYQHLLTPDETISLTLSYHGSNNKPRYLRCPVAVSVGHLKKLIRAKYGLTESHRVDVLYNQDCLSSSLTLMDVAYIYFWKKKDPIELTYRIYECVNPVHLNNVVLPEPVSSVNKDNSNNNNNWKEVQLRISENGEMSITGIQESSVNPSLLEVMESDLQYKNEVTLVDSESTDTSGSKKEIPDFNFVTKAQVTESFSTTVSQPEVPLVRPSVEEITVNITSPSAVFTNTSITVHESQPIDLPMQISLSNCASLSSATTTTVFSTINNSKCSTKSDDTFLNNDSANTSGLSGFVKTVVNSEKENSKLTSSPTVNNNVTEKSLKRKADTPEVEPPIKQSKMTIFNNSISLLNLSNNHPLKKHSKMNRNGENAKESPGNLVILENETISGPIKLIKSSNVQTNATTVDFNSQQTTTESSSSKLNFTKKNLSAVQVSRPNTPVSKSTKQSSTKSPSTTYAGLKPPCYVPKTTYNPILSLPKLATTSSSINLIESTTSFNVPTSIISIVTPPNTDSKTISNMSHQQANKIGIKSKPSTPIGYKTLRDPPKSWNSQISKANLTKPSSEQRNSDLKNVKPKFFKMRNNIPRYLGNPASGVKPMYQVQTSPDKDKSSQEITNKVEKSEIKKHSIVKIDPKTLKPISEKAPETTSLSNHNHSAVTTQGFITPNLNNSIAQQTVQNDLKINTSSVSIFNPLKLQSSPKSDRKSPKSPHSPKTKSTISSGKRDKVNLTFTPPNPFVPRLASPLDPGQFLYPPPYDPRVMAAYTSLWYGQRLSQAGFPGAAGFPGTSPAGLSLDLNQQQRKKFEMIAAVAAAQHSTQLSPTSSGISTICGQQTALSMPLKHPSTSKKPPKEQKYEKSLENTVEKLTQNRNKEVKNQSTPNSISIVVENKENGEVDNRLEQKDYKNVENKPNTLFQTKTCPSPGSLQNSQEGIVTVSSHKNNTTKDNDLDNNLTMNQKVNSSEVKQDSSSNVGSFSKPKETSPENHVDITTPEKSETSKESDKLKVVGLENTATADNNNESTIKNDKATKPFNDTEGKCENLLNSVKAVNNSDNKNSEVVVKGVE